MPDSHFPKPRRAGSAMAGLPATAQQLAVLRQLGHEGPILDREAASILIQTLRKSRKQP